MTAVNAYLPAIISAVQIANPTPAAATAGMITVVAASTSLPFYQLTRGIYLQLQPDSAPIFVGGVLGRGIKMTSDFGGLSLIFLQVSNANFVNLIAATDATYTSAQVNYWGC